MGIPRLPRKWSESLVQIVALSWKHKRSGGNEAYLSTQDQMKLYELHKQVLSKIQTIAYHFSFKPFKIRQVTVCPMPEAPKHTEPVP